MALSVQPFRAASLCREEGALDSAEWSGGNPGLCRVKWGEPWILQSGVRGALGLAEWSEVSPRLCSVELGDP